MNLLQNFSLRNKLVTASLIPQIALFYYLLVTVRRQSSNKKDAEEVLIGVFEVQPPSRAVYKFLKDRDLTFSFLVRGRQIKLCCQTDSIK